MFFEPTRTQFDLNWTMFGIPVRVHPFFWLMTALLGWNGVEHGFQFLFLWIACVFVSILIHELGHVVVGQLFGARGHIVLHSFGGLAIGSSNLRNRWQRIAVYLAGPAAGFVLLGIVLWGMTFLDEETAPPLLRLAVHDLRWINLGWGLLNLLPIWPLDGGQVSRDLLNWFSPEKGARTAYGVSFLVAGLLALNAAVLTWGHRSLPLFDMIPYLDNLGDFYVVVLFGCLAFNSYQLLQMESQRRPWDRWDY